MLIPVLQLRQYWPFVAGAALKPLGIGNAAKSNLTLNCIKKKVSCARKASLWTLSQIEFSVHVECLSIA